MTWNIVWNPGASYNWIQITMISGGNVISANLYDNRYYNSHDNQYAENAGRIFVKMTHEGICLEFLYFYGGVPKSDFLNILAS